MQWWKEFKKNNKSNSKNMWLHGKKLSDKIKKFF